jgi:hypothetical protein
MAEIFAYVVIKTKKNSLANTRALSTFIYSDRETDREMLRGSPPARNSRGKYFQIIGQDLGPESWERPREKRNESGEGQLVFLSGVGGPKGWEEMEQKFRLTCERWGGGVNTVCLS